MIINLVGLDISIPTLIWTVINFFLLLFLLKIFLFNPVLKHMDQRNQNIADSLKQGEEAKKLMSKTEEELKNDLTQTGVKARNIIAEGKSQDEKDRVQKLEETHKQVREFKEEIKSEIGSEEASARSEVEEKIPEMVDVLTKSLLKESKE